ncbi:MULTISPECIES: YheC/YheD family protein [Paenibacillus]|uniref:YheC/YheD family protein n=1 Tax=Paenibacillus TaxID=44249 RepID=UPI0004715B20|nr:MULTISPECIES: YheC/YheD family protein [Paenibacillus]MCP3745486.1 YheC/YheD family protein [Paenibacillus sp. A3M_27_13]QYK70070.1 Endospore coat-associated protein YheD [Paenibacillus sp. S02]URJ47967.1 YheC/YheD family protein [Paenibacillus polymyxa]
MPIGKMKKHKEMLQHPVLRSHLPETHWFTDSRTSRMLNTYSSVFIKPNHGSGGSGIIRVKRLKKGYEVRSGSSRKFVGSRFVLKAIKSYRKSRHRYLVQKGLRLAKYHGSIFDTRIYLQKPRGKWVISGVAARVAAPHKYVTNYLKGGHAVSLHRVLFSLFKHNRAKADAYFRRISKLSIIIAKKINERHPVRELGVDIAIDKKGHIWIIEANSHPGHMLFTQFPDPTMINTIMRNKSLIRK